MTSQPYLVSLCSLLKRRSSHRLRCSLAVTRCFLGRCRKPENIGRRDKLFDFERPTQATKVILRYVSTPREAETGHSSMRECSRHHETRQASRRGFAILASMERRPDQTCIISCFFLSISRAAVADGNGERGTRGLYTSKMHASNRTYGPVDLRLAELATKHQMCFDDKTAGGESGFQ